MKKIAVTVICAAMLCSCGATDGGSSSSKAEKTTTSASSSKSNAASDAQQDLESNSSEPVSDKKDRTVTLDSFTEDKGAFRSITFSGVSGSRIGLAQNSRNVLHNGVVGIVGVPFVVMFNSIENGRITVTIDPENLNGIPLKNLLLLHYNENDANYEEIWCEVNEADNSISADITADGDYVVADWYQWGAAWGFDTSEYAHDVTYNSDAPFENIEYPFSVIIPTGCDGFQHTEEYTYKNFDYKTVYRIAGEYVYTFTDISYITPHTEGGEITLDEFSEIMKEAIENEFEWRDGILSEEKITSPDGTEGVKFTSVHKYISGDDYTYAEDILVYYPDGNGGFFEIECEHAEKDEYVEIYDKIISSFKVLQ